jgi:hypothetical protein
MLRLVAGLGLVAGAVLRGLPQDLSAQVSSRDSARADSVRRKADSVRRADSIRLAADTLKRPVGARLTPPNHDILRRFHWTRAEMFATGALTLSDLLDRVPEISTFRAGWLRPPEHAAFNGDPGAIRIFIDGVELDNLNPRAGGLKELQTIQLWSFDEVLVERSGSEARIYLQTWTVDRTHAYTRTDVYTGTQGTDLYRGYFGRRFHNGASIQAGGQQYNTSDYLFGGSGDALSLLARIGISRRGWSLDAFVNTTNGTRNRQAAFQQPRAIPNLEDVRTQAYIRGVLGTVGSSRPWIYAIASRNRFAETSPRVDSAAAEGLRVPPDTTDSTFNQTQYVIGGGVRLGGLTISALERYRIFQGVGYSSSMARADLVQGPLGGSASIEHDLFHAVDRIDASARISLSTILGIGGALSVATPTGAREGEPTTRSLRAEATLGGRRLRLLGGFMTRDTALLIPTVSFSREYVAVATGLSSGFYGGIYGQILPGLTADISGTAWTEKGVYHPQYQSRSWLTYQNSWLSRFPSGDFNVKAAVGVDYRARARFPLSDTTFETTASSRTYNALLEVRIIRGILSVQARNLLGTVYQQIPGYVMPRVITQYGVRWEFWN